MVIQASNVCGLRIRILFAAAVFLSDIFKLEFESQREADVPSALSSFDRDARRNHSHSSGLLIELQFVGSATPSFLPNAED